MTTLPCVVRGCRKEATEILDHVDGGVVMMCKPHEGGWFTSRARREALALMPKYGSAIMGKIAFDHWLKEEEKAITSLDAVHGLGRVGVFGEEA